mmetsp:Transcript_4881/g.14032  ORF Transcript_4881/g.14032 Transcript_4881/m.14032 type:complete len:248 (-) Transcript_4881:347-1090(-)
MGHPYVTLSTIVATISVLPGTIAYLGRRSLPPIVTYALTHAAVSGFAVSLAASPPLAAITTGMLGKRSTGDISALGIVTWWPYHLCLRTKLSVQRRISSEPAWNQILPGWYLGAWVGRRQALPADAGAIVDLTCELPLRTKYRSLPYLNIPTWDTYAPSVEQIEQGVQWALGQRKLGRGVYVHCAHGHGRSNVLICAALVADGQAATFQEAHAIVRSRRPRAKLNKRQFQALVDWSAWREQQTKRSS